MASEEAFTLDGLALNDGTTFAIDAGKGVDMTPPKKRTEWIGAADSEAQLLVRDPFYENRTVTIPIVVVQQSTMDLAHDKIALIIDKLQKASKYADGVALTWTPSTGTRTVTFDVLAGEIVGLPVNEDDGWLSKAPELSITLTCKPYWRGTETLTSTASSSTPFVTQTVTNTGDVPGLGRLIVTDTATQSRRYVEWGVEGPLTYNASTSLLVDSDDMVTTGFSGTQTTLAGTYDPNASGNNAIASSMIAAQTFAVAGLGNLSHVGSFRVKARIIATLGTQVRLSWKVGDGPLLSNEWANTFIESAWLELDLGTVTIPTVLSGTQRWTGQIEAYHPTAAGAVYIDYLVLVPVSDGYGKSRATFAYAPGVIVGRDEFTSTTATAALNARVAPAGGTWATSGSATDFAFADDLSGEQVKRSTTGDAGPRWAILGSTNYTDTQAEAIIRRSGFTTAGTLGVGVVARWVDSSNYLRAALVADTSALSYTFSLIQRVAGVDTTLATLDVRTLWFTGSYYAVRVIVFSSGRALAYLLNGAKTLTIGTLEATSSSLATGGALATGKPGLYDYTPGTGSFVGDRHYDEFAVATPAAEPISLYSGRNMQIRYDDVIRQDSTGTYTGRPPSYRGSRFLVPVGTSRVLAKAHRSDIEAAASDAVTDALQIQVGYTPRGLAVPRT